MQIERDNKILLEKMTNIMTKKQNDVHFVYNSKFWNNIYIYIYNVYLLNIDISYKIFIYIYII